MGEYAAEATYLPPVQAAVKDTVTHLEEPVLLENL